MPKEKQPEYKGNIDQMYVTPIIRSQKEQKFWK
jgi:hypothetical protein